MGSGAAAPGAMPRSSLSHILLQLHFSLPMGAGLYDGIIFLLLKLLAQVPACLSPFAWTGCGDAEARVWIGGGGWEKREIAELWLNCATP